MLLEAKALYTFDLVGAEAWVRRYPEKVARDLAKLRELKTSAQLFGLVLATHPRDRIARELRDVAKYSSGIAKAVGDLREPAAVKQQARLNIESFLQRLGEVHHGHIQAGRAGGVRVEVLYWLVALIS